MNANSSVRFDSLRLDNYRVYRKAWFDFPQGSPYDLHVVVGHGGCGKTNLMNAMSWCLYGRERYMPSKSEGLPIRYEPLGTVGIHPTGPVSVELTVAKKDSNVPAAILDSFVRSEGNDVSIFKHVQTCNAEITQTDTAERTSRYVNTLIPSQMKSYYFFDGEKIQDFLFGQATSNVEPALSYLSRIRLLQTTLDHLTALQTDLQRQVGKNDPAMLMLIDQKDDDVENLNNIRSLLRSQEEARDKSKDERDRCDQLLHSQSEAADLPERQTRLEERTDDLQARIRTATAAYYAAVYRMVGHSLSCSAMVRFDGLVSEKESRSELPLPVGPSLLERVLREGLCICGRPLDDATRVRERLETLLQQVKQVSRLGSVVGPIRQHMSFVEQSLPHECDEVRTLRASWIGLRQDLQRASAELAGVALELQQVDADLIRQTQQERQRQQRLYEKSLDEIASTKAEIQILERRLEGHEKAIEAAQAREVAVENFKARLAVIGSAIDIAKEVLTRRIDMVRSYVSERFGEALQDMMWQKDLYSSAFLDESYRIHVIHAGGGEALATMAESEKEVAAVAFILALHEVSGYQGPLVVDFPFGRTTGKMTEQIAAVLGALSQDRQVILLMTDTEFETTRSTLQPYIASHHTLRRRNGETIVEANDD